MRRYLASQLSVSATVALDPEIAFQVGEDLARAHRTTNVFPETCLELGAEPRFFWRWAGLSMRRRDDQNEHISLFEMHSLVDLESAPTEELRCGSTVDSEGTA